MTPQQFAELLQEQGFQGKLSVAGGRVAQILSGAQGIEYTITFFPHSPDGSSVEDFSAFSFMFRSELSYEENHEVVNALNVSTRFLRYSVADGIMSTEMDCAISSDKLDEELAMRQVNIWVIGLSNFIRSQSE